MRLRSKILNLPVSSSTAGHRIVLKDDKNKSRVKESTRLTTRLGKSKAVIGGGDGNPKL